MQHYCFFSSKSYELTPFKDNRKLFRETQSIDQSIRTQLHNSVACIQASQRRIFHISVGLLIAVTSFYCHLYFIFVVTIAPSPFYCRVTFYFWHTRPFHHLLLTSRSLSCLHFMHGVFQFFSYLLHSSVLFFLFTTFALIF